MKRESIEKARNYVEDWTKGTSSQALYQPSTFSQPNNFLLYTYLKILTQFFSYKT